MQGIKMTHSGDGLERESYENAEEIIFSLIERISLGQGIFCKSKDCRFFLGGCVSGCGARKVFLKGGICKYYRKCSKDSGWREDIDRKIFERRYVMQGDDIIYEEPLVMLINSLIDHIGSGEGIKCKTYDCKYWQPDFGDGCGIKRIALRKGICHVCEKGRSEIRKDLKREQMFYPGDLNLPKEKTPSAKQLKNTLNSLKPKNWGKKKTKTKKQ